MEHGAGGSARSRAATAAAGRTNDPDAVGVADAAQRIGVAASTLRAWDRRYGVRPTSRTRGGHRRYSTDDLAALQRMRALIASGVPTASAAALNADTCADASRKLSLASRAGGDAAADRFADAVRSTAADQISRAVTRLLRQRGAASAWTEVFVPCLQSLGERWASSGDGIDEEHVAVAALQATLRAHTTRRGGRSGPARALLAAVPDDRHTLPLDALAAALADAGIRSRVLYDIPASVLHAALARNRDASLLLWSRGGADLPLLRGLAAQNDRVCAAGPGWRRTRLPARVPLVTTLPQAVYTLTAITATP